MIPQGCTIDFEQCLISPPPIFCVPHSKERVRNILDYNIRSKLTGEHDVARVNVY